MHMPPGYRENGKVLRLNKALFGLRRSSILWQKKLTTALVSLGFTPVPHEPCCLTLEGILVFFYVDDIVFAYRRDREGEARRLIKGLDSQYKLSGGENLQWFLGIEILRDRPNRRLVDLQDVFGIYLR
jgi:reverse transcriptase-like protein